MAIASREWPSSAVRRYSHPPHGASKAPAVEGDGAVLVFPVMVLAGHDVMRGPLEMRPDLLAKKILLGELVRCAGRWMRVWKLAMRFNILRVIDDARHRHDFSYRQA
jgi:hypothetical protein